MGYSALWGLAVGVQATISTAAYGNSGNGYLLPAVEGGVQQFGIRATAVTPQARPAPRVQAGCDGYGNECIFPVSLS